ncbi:MAG: NAD(P)/FAD-dependent oxidoreductase [Ilumatobacter sp.]|jgi:cation diffusion facilitator CzcD-associated flavoprotein CzcO|uniref:flavin-containing monooxygenase n=1 Tax=Ilumatobacter sp. TaxID=1967498 RepID=UPI001D7086C8|nr:NAD(P)/FAD-dependent oxidoreductase [Ilumatobacter sp.]MBT5867171.1 NAD(P)/FAD-dependent oxidoreductase [Ilumatobacter sp.]MDG0975496.1 NAD(P)/FAD-dependent oxidoreductase [Ilumatobacter sp.]MDG1785586.1 NAD(P)/FAD-dependent oxidoreductase [Ilumatobacter sp.]MDG2234262.1 NAD(P)/FAD-dependent oxidoreductase [Ilumatobacter sp.]
MTDAVTEHVDVLIVGAGISGIGGAYHLRDQCPDKTFVVLENQDGFGGTWRTHTYPGVRSDSDLHTFGYRFKPWRNAPIGSAEEIMTYLGEVIDENDLARHIRYQHAISAATWSSEDKLWTLEVTQTSTGEQLRFTANFLWMCQGYYRHSEGYTPTWEGMENFRGPIVHPQTWPDDLDYAGKNVVVIGSGATAATLIPAMVDDCNHITMLQRSPTYFATGRNINELVESLREIDIDEAWIHEIARRRILHDQHAFMELAATEPDMVKEELFAAIREYLGDDYDIEKHFGPSYRPWQQRVAFVPDGDLFQGIASGQASVVTDHIVRFNETGIELASGEQLDADIIVTATGFNLNVLGDIAFTIDGEPLAFHDSVTYRGTMFSGIPNMAWVFGYFRASWTLRADMIGDFVCRLLRHMDDKGAAMVTPMLREADSDMALLPWVDPENFNPGYLSRGLHLLPKQGDREPWQHKQMYWVEKDELPAADLDDGTLVYD